MDRVSRRERAERQALWRYQLIREAADESLTAKQRGRLVREIASRSHPGTDGGAVTVSRETLDRWISAWRKNGFAGLEPKGRVSARRTPADVLGLAVQLKKERPGRTAAQVRRIMVRMAGDAPSESTLLREFRRQNLASVPVTSHGRFEADFVNELWVGDALHGPMLGGRKTYLFAFLDDCARYCTAARWALSEDSARLGIALRPALSAWGIPCQIYVDNGSAFKDEQLSRVCARLGIRLIHSRPLKPQGRGKIERFFATVTSQFLVEVDPDGRAGTGTPVTCVSELNDLFKAWLETCYHQQINDTTGMTPQDRWNQGWARERPRRVEAERLAEAFLWSQTRVVTAQATVQLFSNVYDVDPALARKKVELVYDPYDLTRPLNIIADGRPAGVARPQTITRHVHKKTEAARRDEPTLNPGDTPATGVDYLKLIHQARQQELASQGLDYAALTRTDNPS